MEGMWWGLRLQKEIVRKEIVMTMTLALKDFWKRIFLQHHCKPKQPSESAVTENEMLAVST